MKILVASLAMISALSPAIAQNNQQFDLLCAGALEGNPSSEASQDYHFRVNLESNEWCSGECEVIQSVEGVDADQITLVDEINPPFLEVIRYQRASGNFIHIIEGEYQPGVATASQSYTGECQVVAFTGFPESSSNDIFSERAATSHNLQMELIEKLNKLSVEDLYAVLRFINSLSQSDRSD